MEDGLVLWCFFIFLLLYLLVMNEKKKRNAFMIDKLFIHQHILATFSSELAMKLKSIREQGEYLIDVEKTRYLND